MPLEYRNTGEYMIRLRRSYVPGAMMLGVAVVAGAVGVLLLTRHAEQRRVSAQTLPITSAQIGPTYTDCSMVGLASYTPNRPCDTYFLISSPRFHTATALLSAEEQWLRTAGWRYSRAETWGQTLTDYGWIGRHHEGCAVVMTAAIGARAQARPQASSPMGPRFVAFGRRATAATRTPTLEALLQPGYDQDGQPRC
jgi:hypothetical protein